jgi:hypothetical protein
MNEICAMRLCACVRIPRANLIQIFVIISISQYTRHAYNVGYIYRILRAYLFSEHSYRRPSAFDIIIA